MSVSVRWKAVLCIILAILQMSYIFVMSAQDSEDSSVVSAFVSKIVGQFTVGDFRDKTKEEQDDIVSAIDSPLREAAHFIEYTILGVLLFLSIYYSYYQRWKMRSYLLISFGIGLLYAVSDEIHQIFVPGRAFELFDIGVDAAGALTGGLLVCGILYMVKKRTIP